MNNIRCVYACVCVHVMNMLIPPQEAMTRLLSPDVTNYGLTAVRVCVYVRVMV